VSGAYQALNLWSASRAYPNPVVPDVGQALAFEQTRLMRQARKASGPSGVAADDLVPPWTGIGPTNIGGRTLALAIHPTDPDIMFAGSASGGLWKTTTGGVGADAWDPVDTGYPVLAVSTIAIDPAAPGTMYIGTGEVYAYQNALGGDVDRGTRGSYGIGILKSTDGGATWIKSLDWSYNQSRGVWAVRIHPTNHSILYAATTEGVYKSLDAGTTWTLQLPVIMAMDLQIHPTQPESVYVACGNFGSAGRGIYRTANGGATWSQLAGNLPGFTGKASLAIAPSSPNIIYASMANSTYGLGLYKSLDSGDTWSRVNNTDYAQYQGWYSHWVVVSPFDPDDVLVGGIEIWRSTDGGATLVQRSEWTQIFLGTPPPEGPGGGLQYAHADHHFAVWRPTDPDVVFFASDGGIFRTDDFCDTFVSLNGGYVTAQFYNGFSNSATDPDLAIGGMQDNLTAIYEGGPAWNRVIGGDGGWTAIHPGDQTLFGSAQYLSLFRSDDGGVNWTDITPPELPGDVTAFIAPFVMAPSLPTTLYGGRARVYRTGASGDSWAATSGVVDGGNPIEVMAVSATNHNKLYVATAPVSNPMSVFRSTSAGVAWTDITGTLPDRYPGDLIVDPANDSVVYITLMGFGTSHVFRSDNGGASWTDIGAGLPDIPTSAIALDPGNPGVIYVGTDLGGYVSQDAGGSWEPFMDGMPPAMINDLRVAPGGKIRAATHGRGVFERDLIDLAATGIGDVATAPIPLRVSPNPLTTASRVSFDLKEETRVRLGVYDASGREVALLLDGMGTPGPHSIPLDLSGRAQGVYFVRLAAGAGSETARVVYLR